MSVGMENPFQSISVRGLVAWALLGGILFAALDGLMALLTDSKTSLPEVVFLGGITAWPLVWVRRTFHRHGIRILDFMGNMPRQQRWPAWLLMVAALIGFAVGCTFLLWYPLSFVVPSLLDDLILSDNTFFSAAGRPHPMSFVFVRIALAVVLAPFVEELCFRGIILRRWTLKWGLRTSVVLSSLLFGMLHADVIGAAMFGFVMAILYIRTQSLWVPILLHALNNAAVYVLEGLEYAATGPVKPTIDDFRSGIWIGVACLGVTLPWAVWFIMRNWPKADWRLPPVPEPVRAGDV